MQGNKAVQKYPEALEAPALWNPNVAANWSLIFTPIFGAYLHWKNWVALGQSQKAGLAQKWFYSAIGLMGVYPLQLVVLPNMRIAEELVRLTGIVFLLSWYFGPARDQSKFVKDRFETSYPHRAWEKPLGLAALVAISFFAATFLFAFVVLAA